MLTITPIMWFQDFIRNLEYNKKKLSYFFSSVFEGKNIPYPKREFLTDDEDDKADTGASKVKYEDMDMLNILNWDKALLLVF